MRGGSNQHVSSLLILTEGYLLRGIIALITFVFYFFDSPNFLSHLKT